MTSPSDALELRCGLVLKNRIEKSATAECLATEHGHPTPLHAALYARWAAGGCGLMVTGNVMVDRRHRTSRCDVVLDDQSPRAPFERWASRAREAGVPLLVQLSHPGRQTPRSVDPAPVSCSAAPLRVGPWPLSTVATRVAFAPPRALEPDEVRTLIVRFAEAAARACAWGFAGVQIHAGHGYLIHQFLSPRDNDRTDDWGGTATKRKRLLLEIVSAVRARVPASFAVAVKLNGSRDDDDLAEAEAITLVDELVHLGVDFLELTGGSYERDAVLGLRAPGPDEPLYAPFAAVLRQHTRAVIALTGGFRTPRGVRRALASGLCDLVGLARALILAPDLPARLHEHPAASQPLRATVPWSGAVGAALELSAYEHALHRLARGQDPTAAASRGNDLSRAVRRLLL